MTIQSIEYCELYVEDADQTVAQLENVLGFTLAGELPANEHEPRHRSLLLTSQNLRLVVTAGLDRTAPAALFAAMHGDGVRDVAMTVEDIDEALARAINGGATILRPIERWSGRKGSGRRATVSGVGDVVHTLLERETPGADYLDQFMVESTKIERYYRRRPAFAGLDHVAYCTHAADLEAAGAFFCRALGFSISQRERVETARGGLNSLVVESPGGAVRFPIQAPLNGTDVGPLMQFLKANRGAGVHHLALLSDDIAPCLRELRERGLTFHETPPAYFEGLRDRVGELDVDIESLRELSVLADRDESGYLLQVFARPMVARKTFFFEVIQRQAARGFGNANVKALLESLETG